MADFNHLSSQVGDALSQALAGESEMVTRWVAVIEVMDETGGRAAYIMTHPGAKTWDMLGLLAFGMQTEQAAAIQDD